MNPQQPVYHMETRTYQIEPGYSSLMTDAEARAANKMLRAEGSDKRWVPVEKITHCPFVTES